MMSVFHRMPRSISLASFALIGATAVSAPAQSWRTLTAARQRGTADSLTVHVSLDAGTVQLAAATTPVLYDYQLRFDAGRVRPERRYDAATHTLRIRSDSVSDNPLSFDLRRGTMHFASDGDDDRGTNLTLRLARGVPLSLSFTLGACDATLDLSNLAVHRLRLRSGASESTLTFGTPNPITMSALDIAIGAADLTVRSLGNARADTVSVSTGVGGADLDLAGTWAGTMHVVVRAALGSVTLRVPSDAGIEARAATKLGSLDAPGLVAHDGVYHSANWTSAARKVVLDVSATLANVEIRRE
jgi:hypothetical protein